jgi:hypothetical protein
LDRQVCAVETRRKIFNLEDRPLIIPAEVDVAPPQWSKVAEEGVGDGDDPSLVTGLGRSEGEFVHQ